MLYEVLHMHPVLIVAAVVPAAVLLFFIYRADRLEKEPTKLLLLLLGLGLVSTGLAAFAERLGEGILDYFLREDSLTHAILLYFVVVAGAEEGFKYLLLKKATWRSPHFNCQFDGVVYAVFVSLGFALWENLGYVAFYGLATAVVRALTAVPGHACFGVFMGAWYGQAKRRELSGDVAGSATDRRLSLFIPILLHGTYDFVATLPSDNLIWVFVVFVLAMFIAALRKVRKLSRTDDYMDKPPRDPMQP